MAMMHGLHDERCHTQQPSSKLHARLQWIELMPRPCIDREGEHGEDLLEQGMWGLGWG